MSGRKPGRPRRRTRKWARRPLAVRVKFEREPFGAPPPMVILRTGAPYANNTRGTVITPGPWSNLRVNFSALRPGKFIRVLAGNEQILRGQVIGGRIASVTPIKQW